MTSSPFKGPVYYGARRPIGIVGAQSRLVGFGKAGNVAVPRVVHRYGFRRKEPYVPYSIVWSEYRQDYTGGDPYRQEWGPPWVKKSPRVVVTCKREHANRVEYLVNDGRTGRLFRFCRDCWMRLMRSFKFSAITNPERQAPVGPSAEERGELVKHGEVKAMVKIPMPEVEERERLPFIRVPDVVKMAGRDGKMITGRIKGRPWLGDYGLNVPVEFGGTRGFPKTGYILTLKAEPSREYYSLNYTRSVQALGLETDAWVGRSLRVGMGKTADGADFIKIEPADPAPAPAKSNGSAKTGRGGKAQRKA